MLDKAAIAARIPHQGTMCLLEKVEAWDTHHITCTASSHRNPGNPLRYQGRLGSACGIEYAAQAMAMHGALMATDQNAPTSGFLVSVRSVNLHTERLDDLAADIDIRATCLGSQAGHILYEFTLHADSILLVEGRAAVVTDAASLAPAHPPSHPAVKPSGKNT